MESPARWYRVIQLLYWSALVVAMLLCAGLPVADPDFWWHLQSGKLMWEQGWLIDPATVAGGDGLRARLVLQGYWLWEVITYGCYAWLGMGGILGIKILTVLALLGVVGWRMCRLRIHPGVTMLLCTIGFVLIGKAYYLERPQMFSFLFAALLLGLFDQVRDRGRLSWLLLPLMALWGNIHGGVVVGDLLLLCFGLGMLWEWRHRRADLGRLVLWVGAGIAASLIQPTGWRIFSVLFKYDSDRILYSVITEYESTFSAFGNNEWAIAGLWLLMAVHAVGLILAKRRWLPDLLIFGFLVLFCAQYMRNVGFFAISLLPVTAWYVNQILVSREVVKIAAIASLVGVLGFGLMQAEMLSRSEGMVSSKVPQGVADFLVANHLRAPILNDYGWGGYLLWRMHPVNPLLVDGRTLNVATFTDYVRVVAADWSGNSVNREALDVLEKYNIGVVALHHMNFFDSVFPLTKHLLDSGGWAPVYADELGYVLVRKTGQHEAIMQTYGMSACSLFATMFRAVDESDPEGPDQELRAVARAILAAQLESCPQTAVPGKASGAVQTM